MNEKVWVCYVLIHQNGHRTYCGMTGNFARRLRQHNGEISGGAKYTKGGVWKPFFVVKGFSNQKEAMQFERAMKKRHVKRKIRSGPAGRCQQLEGIVSSGLRVVCFVSQNEYIRMSRFHNEQEWKDFCVVKKVDYYFR